MDVDAVDLNVDSDEGMVMETDMVMDIEMDG